MSYRPGNVVVISQKIPSSNPLLNELCSEILAQKSVVFFKFGLPPILLEFLMRVYRDVCFATSEIKSTIVFCVAKLSSIDDGEFKPSEELKEAAEKW